MIKLNVSLPNFMMSSIYLNNTQGVIVPVFGVSECAKESTNDLIRNLPQDRLGVDIGNNDNERCHRIGKPNNKGQSDNRQVHNLLCQAKDSYSKKKLKSTGIVI